MIATAAMRAPRALAAAAAVAAAAAGSFVVANDTFMRDGAPFIARSGSLHYHRTLPGLWADRLG